MSSAIFGTELYQKIILYLSEIQIESSVLYYIWRLYIRPVVGCGMLQGGRGDAQTGLGMGGGSFGSFSFPRVSLEHLFQNPLGGGQAGGGSPGHRGAPSLRPPEQSQTFLPRALCSLLWWSPLLRAVGADGEVGRAGLVIRLDQGKNPGQGGPLRSHRLGRLALCWQVLI